MIRFSRSVFYLWLLACCTPNIGLAYIYVVNNSDELRQALLEAQQNNESNTIYLAPGRYASGTAGPYTFQSPYGHNLTLIGNSSDPGATLLDGGSFDKVLVLSNGQPGGTFSLQGLTLVSTGQGLQAQNARTRIEACEFVTSSSPASIPETNTPDADPASDPDRSWWGNNGSGVSKADREMDEELQKRVRQAKGPWVLLGTNRSIGNMKIFDRYNAVWAYQDGAWKAYSSRQDIRLRLHEHRIGELKQIPAYSGFWIWRD